MAGKVAGGGRDRVLKMWFLVSFSFRFVWPELTLSVQLEKLDAELLDSKFARYHICTVFGILFVGLAAMEKESMADLKCSKKWDTRLSSKRGDEVSGPGQS